MSALNRSTHRLVNRQAAQASTQFTEYLSRSLGFSGGLSTSLRHAGREATIQEWIEEGGDREDDLLRSLRHFHDPLKPWDSAGLDLGVARYASSVRWMQQAEQRGLSAGGSWAWRDARRLYHQALTEADPEHREALWADLFRALGQIMHLVADASVPEHVRNDTHVLGALKVGNSYERWVGDQHGGGDPTREAQFIARYLSASIGFDPRLLQLAPPDGESVATVPIARLIDSDRYNGANPRVTLESTIGIGEVANANFYSESTLTGQYPFPTDAGLTPVSLTTPWGRVRRYFSRPDGLGLLPATPLRAECAGEAFYWRAEMVQPPPYPCLDGVVWNQVAAHMLPRVVGYARGVLDYFFRGALSVQLVYWDSEGAQIAIQNETEEELEGVFDVYLRHSSGTEEERRELAGSASHGQRTTIGPRAAVTVPLSLVPTAAASPDAVLVFTGRLGGEEDAVIGQVFTVPLLEVVQTDFVADVDSTCEGLRDVSGTVTTCRWRSVNMDVSGIFVSNTLEPVIAQVDASWANQTTPVELDGVTYPTGWRRTGHEPDPVGFRLRVPNTARLDGSLFLDVTLTNGEFRFVQLAAFESGSSMYLSYVGPRAQGGWHVLSQGTFDIRVGYTEGIDTRLLPSFTARTIGGYPNPTSTIRYLDADNPAIVDGVEVDRGRYFESTVAAFEVFGTEEEARAYWGTLPPPMAPTALWEAEVQRAYRPNELPLMRAFFSATPPGPIVRLLGHTP